MPRLRSNRLVTGHAEPNELGVQAPAVLASDADLGRPHRLAVPGGGAHAPCDGTDEEEDPPESHEPSSDSREDPANHEEDDRSHHRAEDPQDPTASEGRPDRPRDESERRVDDNHDADNREQRADEEDRHGPPSERERGRTALNATHRIDGVYRHATRTGISSLSPYAPSVHPLISL